MWTVAEEEGGRGTGVKGDRDRTGEGSVSGWRKGGRRRSLSGEPETRARLLERQKSFLWRTRERRGGPVEVRFLWFSSTCHEEAADAGPRRWDRGGRAQRTGRLTSIGAK